MCCTECGLLELAAADTAHRGVNFATLQRIVGELRGEGLAPSRWCDVRAMLNGLNMTTMNGNVPPAKTVNSRCEEDEDAEDYEQRVMRKVRLLPYICLGACTCEPR